MEKRQPATKDVEHYLSVQEFITHLSKKVAEADNIDDVTKLLTEVANYINVYTIRFYIYDSSSQLHTCAYGIRNKKNYAISDSDHASHIPYCHERLVNDEVVNIYDIRVDERVESNERESYINDGDICMFAVPFHQHGRLVATLVASCPQPRLWSSQDQWIITQCCLQVLSLWLRLEKHRFANELIIEREWWNSVTRQTYLSEGNDNDIYKLLSRLGEFIRVDRACCFTSEGDALEFLLEWCAKDVAPSSDSWRGRQLTETDHSMFGAVLAGEQVIVNDVHQSDVISEFNEIIEDEDNLGAYMLIPLFYHQKVFGAITVDIVGRAYQWSDKERQIVITFAELMGIMLGRSKIAKQLKLSEQRFALAMDASKDGVWDYDIKKGVMYKSPAVYRMLGYSPDEFPDTEEAFAALVDPEFKDLYGPLDSDIQSVNDSKIQIELPMLHKNGHRVWVQIKGTYVSLDHNRKPLRSVGVITDITKTKEVNEKIRVESQRADAANQAKSEFLAKMSHEIRSPMNAIIGMVYLLNDTDLSEQQLDYINDIESASSILLHVINDILDFSKIEAGKIDIENIDFKLSDVFDRLSSVMVIKANEKQLSLNYEIPSEFTLMTLKGDPIRFGQVLINLVNNAIKFTSTGSVYVSVAIIARSSSKLTLSLKVKDTGIGMNKTQIEKLFKPFSQADVSTARNYGGTGLGLAISKALVELMGGSIEVASEKDAGTTFQFTLPVEFKKSETMKENLFLSGSRNNSQYLEVLEGVKVLLVEDNPVNQKVAQGILKRVGVEVEILNDGVDALELAKQGGLDAFELILMDVEMPIMDGITATRAIRALKSIKQIPIIAMSARALNEDVSAFEQAGMNDSVPKPINPEQLYSVVARFSKNHN